MVADPLKSLCFELAREQAAITWPLRRTRTMRGQLNPEPAHWDLSLTADLARLRVIRKMINAGCTPSQAASYVEELLVP